MAKGSVKEYRVVCGKSRTCKIVNGIVSEVFDEKKGQYVPLDEFERDYSGNTDQVVASDVKEEKKEYYTTHGKKEYGKKMKFPESGYITPPPEMLNPKKNVDDKMVVKKVVDTKSKAVGTVTTSNVNLPNVELPGNNNLTLPERDEITEIEVKDEPKKEKFLEKNYHNIVEETIDLLYMQED